MTCMRSVRMHGRAVPLLSTVLPRMSQSALSLCSATPSPLLRSCQTLTARSFSVLVLSAAMDSTKRNSQPRPQNETGKKIQGTIHIHSPKRQVELGFLLRSRGTTFPSYCTFFSHLLPTLKPAPHLLCEPPPGAFHCAIDALLRAT